MVNCGGMFAAEIGRLVDVRIPLVPMSHQYVVTDAFLERRDHPLPTLRDPDLLVYYRQEVDGLVMGGYERSSEPWATGARSYDAIPQDFNGRLLPEVWDRVEQERDADIVDGDVGGEVGNERTGRLGSQTDVGADGEIQQDAFAEDECIDGAGASAEEAAMHTIDDV